MNAVTERPQEQTIQDLLRDTARRLRGSTMRFMDFMRAAWDIVEPGHPFEENWHHAYIAEHLELVTWGEIQNLDIIEPPRHTKSLQVSVFWPCWEWTINPTLRYLFASYSGSLTTKHSLDRRAVITSDWYQERWGHLITLAPDQNLKTEFMNTRRGVMVATSFGGTATGKGGDRIIMDDPMNPEEAESKPQRESSNSFYDLTLSTRLDNKKTGAEILVMQRLHDKDLYGHRKSKGVDATRVVLPGIAQKKTRYRFPISGQEVSQPAGAPLWKEREGLKVLAKLKIKMGTRAFNAQVLQEPSDPRGNLVKRSWFKFYTELPKVRFWIWSWDTALKVEQQNDYSVGQLWAECDDGYYFIDQFKDKVEFPELKREAKIRWDANKTDALIIEDASSGTPLVQELKRGNKMPVKGVKVDKDKFTRLSLVAPTIESGKVFLPEGKPWVADFIEEVCAFPKAAHDDQVDAMTQGIAYLKNRPKEKILSMR